MPRSRALSAGCLLLPLLVACGDKTPDEADLRPPADQASSDRDLRAAEDLAPANDLRGPTDKPMLQGLPMCNSVVVDVQTLFEKSYKPNCSGGMCHASVKTAADLSAWWVGKASRQTSALSLVKAGSIHESYVMYKLLDQQADPLVMGMGESMPKGKAKLADNDLCNFINWIRGGAG